MTDHRLLPRFRQAVAGTVTHIIETIEHHTPTHGSQPLTAGGDPMQLRGIPAIGHGSAGGHIPGTRPDRLDWVDDRKQKHRKL